ncbi:MAG: hypothetical protein J5598_04085 [Clostridia bacterium]|nr:hypothetical protein [Clostridia bacterium]
MKNNLPSNNFVLHIQVKDESQIFSNYTYNEDNLNYELGNYLQEKAEHEFPLPIKENYTINIHTDNPNLRLAEVTRCIHHHFHNRYDAEKRKLRDNLRFALVLFSIAIVALVGYFLAETYVGNFFLTEIADLLTWVFGWGAVEVSLLERHSIRRRSIILRRLAYAEIKFTSNMKLDAPVYI